jgi:hypothetical protein
MAELKGIFTILIITLLGSSIDSITDIIFTVL